MNQLIIVDLDGTIADERHRRHFIDGDDKDWLSYFKACGEDEPFTYLQEFLLENYERVAFVTGRSEVCRDETLDWIAKHFLIFDANVLFRSIGDHRPAVELKEQVVKDFIDRQVPIAFAIDDDPEVCAMFSRLGIRNMLVSNYV